MFTDDEDSFATILMQTSSKGYNGLATRTDITPDVMHERLADTVCQYV